MWSELLRDLPEGHPWALLEESYPDEARFALLARHQSRKIYRQDLRDRIQKDLRVEPSAEIFIVPGKFWNTWARLYGSPLALYRPDVVWSPEEDEHLLVHELLHSIQNRTSGSLPRGYSKSAILLGEALTEEWVSRRYGERGLYLEEREHLQEVGLCSEELVLWQGSELLRRLPRGVFDLWKEKVS